MQIYFKMGGGVNLLSFNALLRILVDFFSSSMQCLILKRASIVHKSGSPLTISFLFSAPFLPTLTDSHVLCPYLYTSHMVFRYMGSFIRPLVHSTISCWLSKVLGSFFFPFFLFFPPFLFLSLSLQYLIRTILSFLALICWFFLHL